MKKLIVVAGLLLLVGFGLPPVFGLVTEDRVTTNLADGGPSPFVKVYVDDFDRGLYSSTARLKLALTDEYLASLSGMAQNQEMPSPENFAQQQAVDAGARAERPLIFSCDSLWQGPACAGRNAVAVRPAVGLAPATKNRS